MTKRIVSLAPSTTAILCAIGAKDQLVGVTRYCSDLSDVSGLPELGDFWSAHLDEVLNLKPDLIVGSLPYKQEVVQKMIQTGAPFFLTHPKSFEQIYLDIYWLGTLTAHEREAEKLIASMKAEVEAVQRKTQAVTRRPRVYCEEWMKPLITSISWVKEMVEIAGAEYVPAQASSTVTFEQVIQLNPEIIILSWCGVGAKSNPELVKSRPGWDQIDAVRNNQIYPLPDQFFNSPCQHLITGLKMMGQVLHPEIFGAYVSNN